MAPPTEAGPGVTEPPLVGSHTFALRDDNGTPDDLSDDIENVDNACGICHTGLETINRQARGDYDGDGDVEGIQDETRGLMALLVPGLTAIPGVTIDDHLHINVSSADFANMTDAQKMVRYNYNFILEDGSFGIHNTSYAIQILQRSYGELYGRPITDDFPKIDLRGPVQQTTLTPTPTPSPTPMGTPTPFPTPEARALVNIIGVSPRERDTDTTGIFDEASSGLHAVGVGEKVYMEPNDAEIEDDGKVIVGYAWRVKQSPAGSSANLSDTAGTLVTFRPDVVGTYVIELTALTANKEITDIYDQVIYANTYVGVGVLEEGADPRAPECAAGFCHGGDSASARLNVVDQWLDTNHARVLEFHLNGERSNHYDTSCLECHTVGFGQASEAVNNGFDDIAADMSYDLQNIVNLVNDAASNDLDNWDQLPAELQHHASVQCESCHGAGSRHPANLLAPDAGIAGVNLDVDQCARCHDSASGFQQGFYQWDTSAHARADENAYAASREGCNSCHSGDGFLAVQVNGWEHPGQEDPDAITCAVCHDPHGTDKPHELRLSGDTTFPNGTQTYLAGTGGICYRCHNTRSSDPESTAVSSFRGAHHGPQAEVFYGNGGVSFGLDFAEGSPHAIVVEDTCAHCHMAEPTAAGPGVIEPPKVGAHTFSMRDDMGTPDDPSDDVINAEHACSECHLGLDTYDFVIGKDYDGDGVAEGIQTEVHGLLELLKTGLLAIPGMSEGGHGTLDIASGDFANMTDDQKRARYNYNLVVDDGSYGVHNTNYTVQLLQRSYFGVYGKSIVEDYPEIDLAGPVQAVGKRPDSWEVK
jgi:hypothetical protein